MNALIPVADGSESLETVTIVNLLRRADVAVTVASIGSDRTINATRGLVLVADARLEAVLDQSFDLIALPGGEAGARALGACMPLIEKLKAQRRAHRWYAGICAAPALALSPHGLLDGKQATCYPAFRDALLHYVNRPVVVDGHCITSQGPATAVAFGLQLIEALCGTARRRQVAEALLYPGP
ncbi:4-methyl-5(b-hydroxyethyl)-thiazole monophosphate biosynthesis [Fontimonas thermophila]|uniref:4-methyl-5(B-hydroxyethyl)-thiazole monophosphate biosynthesis n=1 Tax=Fontimonas thermophila TaxID=1076937 RepID=A0A1I2IS40_9GAMM|nr:DJ-1 family glyoxalase III [Fontimonas thermophila]SFF45232.1 4-methyl-5(b-hydroxyethyl)-thiazole monophosphate biosynthesis [Fontimonas thermophila]